MYTCSENDNSVKPWQFDLNNLNLDINLNSEIELGYGIINLYSKINMAIYIPFLSSDKI